MRTINRLVLILAGMLCVAMAVAQPAYLRPAPLFCNDMVLQQQQTVPLWGEATPADRITVTTSWDGRTYTAVADASSYWCVDVRTPSAGGPYRITISGRYDIVLENVMVGEVWLCAGQSNMEWSPYSNNKAGIPDLERELTAAGDYPALRFFAVKRDTASMPRAECAGRWRVSEPQSAMWFSAVGQFFGRELQQTLGVPVGLIGSYWGGTGAEVWTPGDVVAADSLLAEAATHQTNDPRWFWPIVPGAAYNAMIHPLVRFPIAGVIWYQGESNAKTYATYARLLEAMTGTWRQAWGCDFPFYIVQISPFYDKEGRQGCNVLLREQQQIAARTIAHSGLVTISDVGDAQDIHPRNKRPVGERLASLALADHYGRAEFDDRRCPLYAGWQARGREAVVCFSHAHGLKTTTGEAPKYFELAGADGVYHPAQAAVRGEQVVVRSDKVRKPVSVRYAWSSLCFPDLTNASGLPVGAFRSKP